MPIQGSEDTGLGASAKQIAEHASALARLELRLAALELAGKAKSLALGIGLALVAVLLLLYALGFGLAAIAAAIPLDAWASLLIVTGGLVLIIAVLAFFALQAFKRGAPPVPNQAIEEAKLTTEAIKAGNGGI
jgi:O-antigen/teichoic acid export membrane protein